MKTRIEKDSMGELTVPAEALYGAQTQRAVNNFPISGKKMPEQFIRSLLMVKAASASANIILSLISNEIGEAILESVQDLLNSTDLMQHFPVDIYQTGSGTSTNMNANEVIARLASLKINQQVSPHDHVNFGQSSNDVIPTTIHTSAAIAIEKQLLPALEKLQKNIEIKAQQLDCYVKTGRTHLMDAMPVRFSQSLLSWASQIEQNISLIRTLQPKLHVVAQGGTAVGTGINAHPEFAYEFTRQLSLKTGINFKSATNFFALIGTQDTAVAVSGQLKGVAVSLMKIANDLRWMNSGPLAGLGEIKLQALQPGSSIMPGKVNPVIPEAVTMVAAQVIGNDSAITVGGLSGNFELNVMLPMIADNLLSSINLLSNSSVLLAEKAISTFTVCTDNLNNTLSKNPILVTALSPLIGYAKAAEIAKLAYKESRPIIDVAVENTDLSREELVLLLDPRKLTYGGL